MGNSDSEPELKRKKEKKQKDKDSGDERKEKKDKDKEEKKPKTDKGKEERKEKKDKEKEYGDKDKGKEERKEKKDKGKEDKGKEEKKEKKDKGKEEKGKEEKKEKKDKGKEEKDKEKDEKKEKKDKGKEEKDKEKKKHKDDKDHDDKEDKPSHPSGSEFHASTGPVQPPHSGEIPWFLREADTAPVHQQPSQTNPNFPIQSPPHQYSVYPPSQQQPFRAVGEAGGVPSTENVPPSGHRVPLSPNDPFPTPDRLGQPPATESGGSIPVYIGSAIFPDSVHPCRIVPSLNPPCRVLYGGGEVEHHGRYDLLPITQDMEWVPTKLGELPPGRRPVEGGYESNGNKLYHALGPVKGAYAAGKAGQHLRGAIVPFEGNEHHVQENYSVLCWR